MALNDEVIRLLKSADYDELETLESGALQRGDRELANAVNKELRSRRDDVVASLLNVIEFIESLEWPEE